MFSHSAGAWKPKVKRPAGLVSGGASLVRVSVGSGSASSDSPKSQTIFLSLGLSVGMWLQVFPERLRGRLLLCFFNTLELAQDPSLGMPNFSLIRTLGLRADSGLTTQ